MYFGSFRQELGTREYIKKSEHKIIKENIYAVRQKRKHNSVKLLRNKAKVR